MLILVEKSGSVEAFTDYEFVKSDYQFERKALGFSHGDISDRIHLWNTNQTTTWSIPVNTSHSY